VRAIPAGETMTYGEVARALGEPPQAAQEVGQAMGRNPCPIIMPCHRVLAAGGKIGGFSAPGGAATKRRLLEIEGAMAADQLPLFGG
jgi:methylated-DNA-[protein]-cysteine S-methyltransferase